ncbi:MAG TPA: DUF309 domain-containing protein [Candidatus Limnocylindrales bacterium]
MSTRGARPPRPGTILQGGRRKAFRPLPVPARRRAFEAGLAAYRRGDFFEAHELLEPAWMGTEDLAERALYQGLIKLSAAYVHAVRGNPAGVEKNLAGARIHLSRASEPDGPTAAVRTAAAALVAGIEERLAAGDFGLPAPEVPARLKVGIPRGGGRG